MKRTADYARLDENEGPGIELLSIEDVPASLETTPRQGE